MSDADHVRRCVKRLHAAQAQVDAELKQIVLRVLESTDSKDQKSR
jgi:hypothetical protein